MKPDFTTYESKYKLESRISLSLSLSLTHTHMHTTDSHTRKHTHTHHIIQIAPSTSQSKQAYFKIISGHKCCLIQHYHAFLLKNLVFKGENKQKHDFDNTRAVIDLKNRQFIQTCNYRLVKHL